MSPKHSNPTRARRDKGRRVWARSPYNFVPLPEMVVAAQQPLDHDIYHADALSGVIECGLETCSPTYVRGLMTVGELQAKAEATRPTFVRLRELSERLRADQPSLGPGLSMGMSDDFEVAIAEGSTLVRVGRALFGERPTA